MILGTTSPSLLRNATSPSRRGLGSQGKFTILPRAPLLGELSSGCETERLYRGEVNQRKRVSLFMKIACISLGCPKNQVDLDVMVHFLLSAGHETVADLG